MASTAAIKRSAARSVRKGLAKKRKRRATRRLRQLGNALMCLYLAYGLYSLWATPLWRWEGELRVVGNRLVSRTEILNRLELPESVPLYRIDPQHLAAQLESLPAVARVGVRRWLFPARLELVVLERQALLGINTPGGGAHWMDQEGVVFAAPKGAVKPRFPIRVDAALKPGDRLSPAHREGLFQVLTSWPKGAAGRVDMRAINDVLVVVGGTPARLGGLSEVSVKFALIEQLRPLAKPYADRLEYIDLRFVESPSFKLKEGQHVAARSQKAGPSSPLPRPAPSGSPESHATP